LENHYVVLEYYNKAFTCLYEERPEGKVQGIPRHVYIREILSMQSKKSFMKIWHIYEAHIEEVTKDKMSSVENRSILKYFEDVFGEIPGFPPKRDIDFSINLVPGSALVSKTPYRMGTSKSKEL
jgi:hypothetical protein